MAKMALILVCFWYFVEIKIWFKTAIFGKNFYKWSENEIILIVLANF